MLAVTDLSVAYGRVQALRGVSLTVEEGETVAVVGPNGAGKSTLLNTIAGRRPPGSGRITFAGTEIGGLEAERITRLGLGLVPEGRHVFETLSVGENLKLGLLASAGRMTEAQLNELLGHRFPVLIRYLDAPAGRLSGGEQQQLAIARAMAARPRMLLLDEPSLGLAPLLVDEVFALIAQLREEGTSILIVEQNAHRAIALANRTYVLKSGDVAMTGDREELERSQTDLTSAYMGSEG